MKRAAAAFIRYGISLLCLVYAFHGVPLRRLWTILQGFPAWAVAATVAVSFAAYAVMGLRLVFMRRPALSFRSAFCASLVGLALNNIFPAKAGELAKAAWIGRDNGLTFDTSLGLVFMERFFDVNVLALLSLWFMLELGQGRTALILLLCVAGGWAVLLLLRWRPQWVYLWERLCLPQRIEKFLVQFTLSLIEQMTLRRFLWMLASSIVLWTFYALQMAAALNWAAGLGLRWTDTLGVFALSSLGMLLPSSPGAIGVYEAIGVTALTAFGVSREEALAVTLFAHMAQFIPVTLAGGLVFLSFPDRAAYRP